MRKLTAFCCFAVLLFILSSSSNARVDISRDQLTGAAIYQPTPPPGKTFDITSDWGAPYTFDDVVQASDLIFSGTVSAFDDAQATVCVQQVYLGQAAGKSLTITRTNADVYSYEAGQAYLFCLAESPQGLIAFHPLLSIYSLENRGEDVEKLLQAIAATR